jgi:hypothetical protein
MPADTDSAENWNVALKYIAGRKAAEESLGFLAHIGATIRRTPEPADVVPAVATACVPFFGSAISVDSPATQDDPVVRCVGDLHAALAAVRILAAEHPGEDLVISSHEKLVNRSHPGHLALLREQGGDSAAVVPLSFRGVRGGLLVLLRGAQHRRGPLSPGDLTLLGEVAGGIAAFTSLALQPTAANR